MSGLRDRMIGCLVGLAVGDALGASVETSPRDSFEPLTDMIGGGPFKLQPGQWTDDTSMALCLGSSLLEKSFDLADQMVRYSRWRDEGYYSSTGKCFDIGDTVNGAIDRYLVDGNPKAGIKDPELAGNGALMRLAPVVLYYYPDHGQSNYYAAQSAKTTHQAKECRQANRIMADKLYLAFSGVPKSMIINTIAENVPTWSRLETIAHGDYQKMSREMISSSGYVVDSLEAALWCFANTENFSDAVLMAANLGDDSDTVAAICGQIAGAHYGFSAIPQAWLDKLAMKDQLVDMGKRLSDHIPSVTTAGDRLEVHIPCQLVTAGLLPEPDAEFDELMQFAASFFPEDFGGLPRCQQLLQLLQKNQIQQPEIVVIRAAMRACYEEIQQHEQPSQEDQQQLKQLLELLRQQL